MASELEAGLDCHSLCKWPCENLLTSVSPHIQEEKQDILCATIKTK